MHASKDIRQIARELLRAMDAPMIPSNLAKAREAVRRLDAEDKESK